MHDTLPLLESIPFPPLRRGPLETLQVNLGYRCNQSCVHCHVNAGPNRREQMSDANCDAVLDFLDQQKPRTLDLTGGAPELHPRFRSLVAAARERGVEVIDRCNLTILFEPGQEGLAEFLSDHDVAVVASLPCYLEDNVDAQRGNGVFASSIRALQRLNELGYGRGEHALSLVYNPQGPVLPPAQEDLEQAYHQQLRERYGIEFDALFVITNMPIHRFGSTLVSKGQFSDYMDLLQASHRTENLAQVMCRSLISVDWQGYLYDCDFNQMLGLPLPNEHRLHLSEVMQTDFQNRAIRVSGHCHACAAGQGSSCGGALE